MHKFHADKKPCKQHILTNVYWQTDIGICGFKYIV